jgi:hypothetical protein
MATHDTIVIGASAGGVQALSELVEGLPADLSATRRAFFREYSDAYQNCPSIMPRPVNASDKGGST